MSTVSRRDFVKYATLGGAATVVLPGMTALSADKVAGANDRVRVAIIGHGKKGGQHRNVFSNLGNVEVVAVCDADRTRGDFTDMRKVLEDPGIDAVVMATPNHWHALGTIWALQAGKHVYVEKPVSHNVFEGHIMLKAAEKYGKIVQAGFQNRSDTGLLQFFPWLHAGNLGKIEMLYGQCFRNRFSIGARTDKPLQPPESVDYNLWLGPADDIPMYRPEFHYDWHWVWNTGNGDIGNQGPHELDLIQWARGDGALPKRVMSFGERFGWNDAGETPHLQLALFDYGDYPCYFEVRDLCLNPESRSAPANHGLRVGIYVKCEGGYFKGGRGGGKACDNDGNVIEHFAGDGGGKHQQNFIDAVRADDPGQIHSRLEDAVKSSDLAHLANTSLRVGQKTNASAVKAALEGDSKAAETVDLFEKHLAAWNIDTNKEKYMLGPWLEFDAAAGQFTRGERYAAANKLLTRAYRDEFVVSKTI